MRRLARSSAGFSLTELMVVLAVLGVMMIASIPNLQRANQTHALNNAVSQIETSMRRARSIAITKRTPVRVTVDQLNRMCLVDQDIDEDGSFSARIAESTFGESVQLSAISFGGGDVVVFDERGAPDRPGSVVLRTREGDGREVLVSAGSGSVMVLKVANLPTP